MIVLCFTMQEEYVIEHTKGKYHVFAFLYARERYS